MRKRQYGPVPKKQEQEIFENYSFLRWKDGVASRKNLDTGKIELITVGPLDENWELSLVLQAEEQGVDPELLEVNRGDYCCLEYYIYDPQDGTLDLVDDVPEVHYKDLPKVLQVFAKGWSRIRRRLWV